MRNSLMYDDFMKRIWATFVVAVIASFGIVAAPLLARSGPAAGAPRARALPTSLDILRLGDSRTIGNGAPWPGGYEPELTRLLAQAGVTPAYAPIGGGTNWNVQGLRGIVDAALAVSTPDIVLLAIGTNNAAGSCGTSPCPGMTGYQDAFYDLVQRIVSTSAAHVFIAEIQYSSASWAFGEVYANGDHITATWQPWCAGRCTLVHMQGIPRCGYLTSDGVHPNGPGYQLMADQWARAILGHYGATVWPAKVIESGAPRPGFEVPAARLSNGC